MSGRARGGDRTPTAIANQIINWISNIKFKDIPGAEPDRAIAELGRGPDKYIDPGISTEENYEIIKEEFGLRTRGDLDQILADAEQMQRQALEREVRGQVEKYGVETIVDAIERPNTAPDDAVRDVNSVLEEWPPDVYRAEILEVVNSLFEQLDQPMRFIPEEEMEERRERVEEFSQQQAERQLLEELRRQLGLEFDELGGALEEIQERLAEGEAVELDSGGIFMVVRPDEFSIELPDRFEEWGGAVRRQVQRELQVENAQDLIDPAGDPLERQDRVRIGTIRTEDGALAGIDLTEGRDRLGTDPDFSGEEVEELQEEESEAADLADSLIDELEGA